MELVRRIVHLACCIPRIFLPIPLEYLSFLCSLNMSMLAVLFFHGLHLFFNVDRANLFSRKSVAEQLSDLFKGLPGLQ